MTRSEFDTTLPADHHIPEEALELYSMNRLPETDTEQLETHLLICEDCQARLKEVDEYVKAVRTALRETQVGQDSTSEPAVVARFAAWFRLRPAYTLCAAFALCLVVLVLPQFRHQPSAQQEVFLQSYRGGEAASAEAGRSLVLLLDTAGLPAASSYVLQVVGSGGRVLIQTEARLAGGSPVLRVPLDRSLATGNYWVRICDRDNPAAVLRETSLAVR